MKTIRTGYLGNGQAIHAFDRIHDDPLCGAHFHATASGAVSLVPWGIKDADRETVTCGRCRKALAAQRSDR